MKTNDPNFPKTLKAFKANAKKYAREEGIPHMLGLEGYAKLWGFESYFIATKYYAETTKE